MTKYQCQKIFLKTSSPLQIIVLALTIITLGINIGNVLLKKRYCCSKANIFLDFIGAGWVITRERSQGIVCETIIRKDDKDYSVKLQEMLRNHKKELVVRIISQ